MPTPRSKAPRFLIYSILLLAAASAGYTAWCFGRMRTMRSEAQALFAEVISVGAPGTVDPAASDLHAKIAEMDRWLEERAPARESILTRLWDGPPQVIDATLAPLQPFFADVDHLLAREAAISSIEHEGTIAPDKFVLESARNWTNLLCTRALRDAQLGAWKEAARRIAQALDLTRLREDGTLFGASLRASCEGIAIGALRRIAGAPDVDAVALRREVEPGLRRAASCRALVAPVAGELRAWIDEGRAIPQNLRARCAWLLQPYHFEWARRELDAYREVVGEALSEASGRPCGPLDAGGHLVTEQTSIENEAFAIRTYLEIGLLARSRVEIARTALALLDHRQTNGSWPATLAEVDFDADPPRDPCAEEAFPLTVIAAGLGLGPARFAAVRGFDRTQAAGLLLDWTCAPSTP